MVSEKISLVVLDMAGTTVLDKREVENCFYEACLQTGLKNVSRNEINSMMGWSKIAVFQKFWKEKLGNDHPEVTQMVETSYQRFKELLESHYIETELSPTEGAVESINWLRGMGIKVALTTGFYRVVTNIILSKLGWDKGLNENYVSVSVANSFIDMSIASDEVESGRPSPLMIQRAMNHFSMKDSKRVIKVGDTPVDLAAGRNANCLLSLAVTNGSHSEEELASLDNDGLLPTIGHLPDFLLRTIR